jgi:hypothetical protein
MTQHCNSVVVPHLVHCSHKASSLPYFDPAASTNVGQCAPNGVLVVSALKVKRRTFYLARRIQVVHAIAGQFPLASKTRGGPRFI